jgi:hypothetical protein
MTARPARVGMMARQLWGASDKFVNLIKTFADQPLKEITTIDSFLKEIQKLVDNLNNQIDIKVVTNLEIASK